MANRPWFKNLSLLLEIFIIVNLAFLAIDIYSAHMVNDFAHWAEWIPFYFSLIAPVFLLPVLFNPNLLSRWNRFAGFFIGWLAIAIGIVGLMYHLESQFFALKTLASLVYTAPFVAPLAYSGLGFLLLLNRMISDSSPSWGVWVVFLALCGFLGNFILSVCDHAQNGFFHWAEWIPVVAAAFAVSFLATFTLRKEDTKFAKLCLFLMAIQLAVGVWGFYYHAKANLGAEGKEVFENFVFGAPVFAPLLFANLALLAALGICQLFFLAKKRT